MKRSIALLWLALVMAASLHVALIARHGLPMQSDFMALLPREDRDPVIERAKNALTEAISQRVVILIGHDDPESARTAALSLRTRLMEAHLLQPANDTPSTDTLKQLGALYFPHRDGLLSSGDRGLLLQGQSAPIINRALSQVFGVMGITNGQMLQHDPFLLFPAFLADLPVPASKLTLVDGWLTVKEGSKTWVMISGSLTENATGLSYQERFVSGFESAFEGLKRQTPDLNVLRLGTVFYARQAAHQAMHESLQMGVLSLLGTILVLVVTFRSPAPMLLGLTAIATGLITALSACLLIYGQIHVAAQLFGASLIGVAADYALLYFGQVFSPRTDPDQRLAYVLPGIALGMATTVVGYATLALSPFPGLQQVAVFAAIGLVSAFLTVILWFPLLDRHPGLTLGGWRLTGAKKLWAFWLDPSHHTLRLAVVGLGVMVSIIGAFCLTMDDDIRHQQALSPQLMAEQTQIKALTGIGQTTQFIVVKGADEQQVLQREEQLGEVLGTQVKAGHLSGWQSLARFVPSQARQHENAMLVQQVLRIPHQAQILDQIGLDAPPEQTTMTPLTLTDLLGSGSLPLLSLLRLSETAHTVALDGVSDLAAVRQAVEGMDGVHFVDPTADITDLLKIYRQRALVLLGLSALLMIPLLKLRYGLKGAVRVMIPPMAAVIMTPLLLALMGQSFSFFAAMALVMVLSIGVDYTVFCAEEDGKRDPVTLAAVGLAMLTALLSFGLMAVSEVAGIRSFGLCMAVGIPLAFVLAPWAGHVRRRLKSFVLMGVVGAALSSCALPDEPMDRVMIAPNVWLALPPPSTLGQDVDAVQRVTAQYDGQTFGFEGRLSVSTQKLLLVATDAAGRRAMTLTWSDHGVEVERASWLPAAVRPQNILADIMLIYWPPEVLKARLSPGVWLEVTPGHRSLWQGDREIVSIHYEGSPWSGTARLTNHAWQYHIIAQSALVAP